LTHSFEYRFNWVSDGDKALEAGLAASKKAVVFNDRLSQSHFALSQSLAFQGELDAANGIIYTSG